MPGTLLFQTPAPAVATRAMTSRFTTPVRTRGPDQRPVMSHLVSSAGAGPGNTHRARRRPGTAWPCCRGRPWPEPETPWRTHTGRRTLGSAAVRPCRPRERSAPAPGAQDRSVCTCERVERALRAMMAKLYPRHVVRCGAFPLRDLDDLVGRHEQERGVLVDEPGDQPGTRNTVDACSFTGHPLHVALLSLRLLAVRQIQRRLQPASQFHRVVIRPEVHVE